MADGITLTVVGLRELDGRLARSDERLRGRRDQVLADVAGDLRQRLATTAPRGPGEGGHLADLFAVGPVRSSGSGAQVEITNSKTVTSKAGTEWNLLLLITEGTPPHAIPGAFGWPNFTAQHPGTQPNPFVENAVRELGVRPRLNQVAGRLIADIFGTGA